MEYATLNNGVKMPMAGIGTFLFDPGRGRGLLRQRLAERLPLDRHRQRLLQRKAVGRAMKKSGLLREEIFLETKLWPTFYTDADAVDKTLARLDTDYIDLLLIHQPAGDYVAGYRLMEKGLQGGQSPCHRSVQLQRGADQRNSEHLRSQAHHPPDRSSPLRPAERTESLPRREWHGDSGMVSAGPR